MAPPGAAMARLEGLRRVQRTLGSMRSHGLAGGGSGLAGEEEERVVAETLAALSERFGSEGPAALSRRRGGTRRPLPVCSYCT